jgi:cytochrome c oxidase cbb3-type subunit 1
MNPQRLEERPAAPLAGDDESVSPLAAAAWHSLAWLLTANAVGVLLAALLLFPGLNRELGEWTYGRWMPVHIDLQLYGWCSLPLVAFLMKAYRADEAPAARWSRAALWLWSAALTVGALSWLSGHSSGKLFLDWTGYARIVFPLAVAFLWLLLAWSFFWRWNDAGPSPVLGRAVKTAGLALLGLVPPILYWSSGTGVYPPINPDTGGPTGASQLESTLVVVAILLMLPFGLDRRKSGSGRWRRIAYAVFALEALNCLLLGRGSVSHRQPAQYLSLSGVLLWAPLMPAYYRSFAWPENAKLWGRAWLCWWALLTPSGWLLFLPGALDHFKYTDGLVGHALMAMAGFVTSLLIFILVTLLGPENEIFAARWAFALWQGSTLGYIAIMVIAGWIEGDNPGFSMIPGTGRNALYGMRLVLGILMTVATLGWFLRASRLAGLRRSALPGRPQRAAGGARTRAKAI